MIFYLGTHEPSWLTRTAQPLFISRRRLARRVALPRALGRWALDSGGFTELQKFGRWETSARVYADEARRWMTEVGGLDFAAVQDWMCEPAIIQGGTFGRLRFAGTRLSVREHQNRTIASYLELRALAPDVPWAPVLQGWIPADYVFHAFLYESAGIDLATAPRVGVGSVCRRQATQEAADILRALRPLGLTLHGFGLKAGFLKLAFAHNLTSCDSMAWSLRARMRGGALDGCAHASCANCYRFALRWCDDMLRLGRRPQQPSLFDPGD